MLRKKGFWLALVAVVLLGGGSYLVYHRLNPPVQAAEEAPLQTATVRRGNLVISASGAGTVIPRTEVALGFSSSGRLAELLAQVGDQVKVGDVLARLDDSNARQALANAQLQVDQARLQTDAGAVARKVALAQISVTQAELNLAAAQDNLDELLTWQPDADAIALAEANLAAAQASYQAAQTRDAVAGDNITAARVSLDQAQRSLDDAQEAYDTAWDPARDWELNDPRRANALENERDAATRNLQRAQESLQVAQSSYNLALANVNRDSAAAAHSSLLSAQQALDQAQSGPSETEITAATQAVRQAELALQQAQLNLEAAQDNSQAEISLEQAQLNVQSAQKTLDETSLTAPIDGVVVSIAASVGETVATSPLLTLADLGQPLVELFLDETDLDKIGVGFEVEVVFDALPDQTFSGQVIEVDPSLVSAGGVSAIRGVVELSPGSFAKPQTLPIGLNATVDVIGGRAENALLVPVEALRELSPGQYAVFVLKDGQPRLQIVQVGLMDFTFAEILSGLNEGDVVTTGIVATN